MDLAWGRDPFPRIKAGSGTIEIRFPVVALAVFIASGSRTDTRSIQAKDMRANNRLEGRLNGPTPKE